MSRPVLEEKSTIEDKVEEPQTIERNYLSNTEARSPETGTGTARTKIR